ncbi:MAG: dienelactone hydrolase family protein [Alphaproteobacteria bacterium]|nr:dienelactone hydrolase family protein [Alphaproteobacteria bacterium]
MQNSTPSQLSAQTEPLLAYRAIQAKNGGPAKSVVVLFHGVGSNGANLVDLALYWRDMLPDTEFICADGPEAYDLVPEDIAHEMNAWQWFSLAGVYDGELQMGGKTLQIMRQRAEKNLPLIQAFLAQILAARNLPASRLALAGFSQGCMMALAAGLAASPPLAGVIGYSGVLMADTAEQLPQQNRPPILLVHGEKDTEVPFSALAHSEKILHAANCDVLAIARPDLGHSIDEFGLMAGGKFLQQIFQTVK